MSNENLSENVWEIFKIRIDALQNINHSMFVDNQNPPTSLGFGKDGPKDALIKSSLVAQAYITTKNPKITDSFDHGYAEKLVNHNIDAAVNPYLIHDLVNAYLTDKQNGIINEKGELIGDLKKSQVMQVPHNNKKNGIPAKARDIVNKYSNSNKLSELRNRVAKKIDKTLGTNLEKKKLPKPLKNTEKIISEKFFER